MTPGNRQQCSGANSSRIILTDERGLKCYLSPFHVKGDLNNIFLYKERNQMAYSNRLAVAAVEHKTDVVIPSRKLKAAPQGSDEIIITIRNGAVVKFVQNIYFSSLEGVDGEGI
jgi:hypothetical protein